MYSHIENCQVVQIVILTYTKPGTQYLTFDSGWQHEVFESNLPILIKDKLSINIAANQSPTVLVIGAVLHGRETNMLDALNLADLIKGLLFIVRPPRCTFHYSRTSRIW